MPVIRSATTAALFDGDPTICWPMNGDGDGQVITIDLGTPTTMILMQEGS